MTTKNNPEWLTVSKAKDVIQIFLMFCTIISLIAALDIFVMTKESQLNKQIVLNDIIRKGTLEILPHKVEGFSDEVSLRQIGNEFYITNPLKLYIDSIINKGYVPDKNMLPNEGDNTTEFFTELKDEKASLSEKITHTIETISRNEEHLAEITINNTGDGDSGTVKITAPPNTEIFDDKGLWNLKNSTATIKSIEPGKSISLLIKGANRFETQDIDIELTNNQSIFRKNYVYVISLIVCVIFTLLLTLYDYLKYRNMNRTAIK